MHEQILLAPNGTELLRMLSRNDTPTLGLRILQPTELARLALMRSGLAQTQTLISPADEAALIFRFLHEITYFESASCQDAQCLADTLRELRLQVREGDERAQIAACLKDSPFTEKNEALLEVYDRYRQALEEGHFTDTAGLLRHAAEAAGLLKAECLVLAGMPLRPLEQALLERVGGYRTVTAGALAGRPEQKRPLPVITEAYGEDFCLSHRHKLRFWPDT